jgi:flagellar assembly protein FliH
MSSKVYRPDEAAPLGAIAWRPAGGSAAPMSPKRPGTGLEGDPDINSRIQSAYQQGHAAGEAAGAERAAQRLDPVFAGLSGMIQELSCTRKRLRVEAEGDTVKLAVAIARRVLHRELATDPEAILGLVKAAFERLNARETHRLLVSPADAAVLQEHRSRLDLPPGLEIQVDASLTQGSAVFETPRGDLDASVGTQLLEIERGLADVMKRRMK